MGSPPKSSVVGIRSIGLTCSKGAHNVLVDVFNRGTATHRSKDARAKAGVSETADRSTGNTSWLYGTIQGAFGENSRETRSPRGKDRRDHQRADQRLRERTVRAGVPSVEGAARTLTK